MGAASMIAVDWGSSTFRAFLLDDNGIVCERISNNDGVLLPHDKPFEQTLDETCGHWHRTHGTLPVIMSGMIGSRNGWIETEYAACPASIDSLASALMPVPGQLSPTHIVPGVSGQNLFGSSDVMRGEEIQVFGTLDIMSVKNALICLPGTHSKWCVVKNGQILSLTTFMTGEMFALMRGNSSVGPLVAGEEFDEPSFASGVTAGHSSAGLLNKLFSIRAGVLLGELHCKSRSSYLSGMFIGREIKAVIDAADTTETIILVGNKELMHRYASALAFSNIQATQVEGDQAFLSGIALLANK